MGEGRLSVVFTGAGTSDYVGDTCAPYLRHAGNTDLYDFKPIATTDIVSAPRDFLRAEDPTLVVSFARSGNSPESLAAVAVERDRGIGRHPARQRQGLRHDRFLHLHDPALHPYFRHCL